jgi:hypothetical protein
LTDTLAKMARPNVASNLGISEWERRGTVGSDRSNADSPPRRGVGSRLPS